MCFWKVNFIPLPFRFGCYVSLRNPHSIPRSILFTLQKHDTATVPTFALLHSNPKTFITQFRLSSFLICKTAMFANFATLQHSNSRIIAPFSFPKNAAVHSVCTLAFFPPHSLASSFDYQLNLSKVLSSI
jgi:hypothetical protein